MTYSEIIKKKIEQLIEARDGLAVNELARRVGMEPATINKVLNNRVGNPSIGTLVYIAKVFGVSVSELLDIEELDNLSAQDIKLMNGRHRKKEDNE